MWLVSSRWSGIGGQSGHGELPAGTHASTNRSSTSWCQLTDSCCTVTMLKHRRRLMPVTRQMIFHPIYCTSKDTVGLDVFLQRRLLICGLHRFLLLYFMLIHCRWLMLVPRQMIFDPIHGTANDSIMPDVVFERRLLIRRLDCPLFLCGVFQHCRRLVLVPRHVILDPIHGATYKPIMLYVFFQGRLLIRHLDWLLFCDKCGHLRQVFLKCLNANRCFLGSSSFCLLLLQSLFIRCWRLVLVTRQVVLHPIHGTTNEPILLNVFPQGRLLIDRLCCFFYSVWWLQRPIIARHILSRHRDCSLRCGGGLLNHCLCRRKRGSFLRLSRRRVVVRELVLGPVRHAREESICLNVLVQTRTFVLRHLEWTSAARKCLPPQQLEI
mmetsp:Transcript_152773/g.292593  ORF Transcript_152773/g.292593 Transcript_152773/m.292593 type:complete len:380 (-) Transcript_152773:27-1166(-)